jgi:hypothetical protein
VAKTATTCLPALIPASPGGPAAENMVLSDAASQTEVTVVVSARATAETPASVIRRLTADAGRLQAQLGYWSSRCSGQISLLLLEQFRLLADILFVAVALHIRRHLALIGRAGATSHGPLAASRLRPLVSTMLNVTAHDLHPMMLSLLPHRELRRRKLQV